MRLAVKLSAMGTIDAARKECTIDEARNSDSCNYVYNGIYILQLYAQLPLLLQVQRHRT